MIRFHRTPVVFPHPIAQVAILLCVMLVPAALSDAIVITRAAQASTILEVLVDEASVEFRLEIGLADFEAFHDLLPDDLYRKLRPDDADLPADVRLRRFCETRLVLRADDGQPRVGELVEIVPRRRIERDVITGEPLAGAQEGEWTLTARIRYVLPPRPAQISIAPQPPESGIPAANIGFIVFHAGLPVTDFRYLSARETLDLDWDDPWYSRFRNRNLRRQYDSPLMAFLYVEPFEVRKEIVLRPRDLQRWVDLGLEGQRTIPIASQEELKRRVLEFLLPRNSVRVDGRLLEPSLSRIHFIRRTLRKAGVIDPPEPLDVVSATLGVIFVYPIDGLPQQVEMDWELFDDRIQSIPTVATDEAGGLPYSLSPDDSTLVWKNFLTNPSVPTLVAVDRPPTSGGILLPLGSALAALLLILATLRGWRLWRKSAGLSAARVATAVATVVAGGAAISFVGVAVANPLGGPAQVSADGAERIVLALLKNVYRAFDYREEEAVYDTLARSATGDLLADLYLEMRRALELENQGGARARVKGVEIIQIAAESLADETGFESRCTWNVTGSVGHWGHVHQRTNQYEAVITVRPVEGAWRVTALDLLDETRIVEPAPGAGA